MKRTDMGTSNSFPARRTLKTTCTAEESSFGERSLHREGVFGAQWRDSYPKFCILGADGGCTGFFTSKKTGIKFVGVWGKVQPLFISKKQGWMFPGREAENARGKWNCGGGTEPPNIFLVCLIDDCTANYEEKGEEWGS